MKDIRVNKKWVDDYNKSIALVDELEVLYEFYKEGEYTVEEIEAQYNFTNTFIEDIEFRNMMSDEGDNLSAVLQITAGA